MAQLGVVRGHDGVPVYWPMYNSMRMYVGGVDRITNSKHNTAPRRSP